MGYIAGLSDAIKLAVKEYCHRHGITQVAWVEKHLINDLNAEKRVISPEEKKEE